MTPDTTQPAPSAEGFADRARAWVESEEGQAAINAGLERARKAADEFREAQKVSWEKLHKPVTI